MLARVTGGKEKAVLLKARQLYSAAIKAAEAEKKATEAENSKYSIEYDKNNRPFVVIEEDILADVPRAEWIKTVIDNLRTKYPNGVEVGNNVIDIDATSRREMTLSRYSRTLLRTLPKIYANKLRATNNADEILKASRNYVNEALKHPRKDNIQEFARGNVLLRIGKNDYRAEVIVGKRANGNLIMYDIIGFQPTNIKK